MERGRGSSVSVELETADDEESLEALQERGVSEASLSQRNVHKGVNVVRTRHNNAPSTSTGD